MKEEEPTSSTLVTMRPCAVVDELWWQNMDELVGPPVIDTNEFGYAGDNES